MAAPPDPPPAPDRLARLADPSAVHLAASAAVLAAAAWWLLGQLAAVLRPLLLAVFLSYLLMPTYARLRRRLPAAVAVALLAGLTTAGLMAAALAVYAGLADLRREGPELKARAVGRLRAAFDWAEQALPEPLARAVGGGRSVDELAADRATDVALSVAGVAAVGLVEAATAGLYLVFLLVESGRFPDRVRAAFPADRADHILHVFGRVNAAIISYLKAKTVAGLVLAVPVGAALGGFGVRFAGLWAALTFACNFVPYLGTAVALALPVGFALVQLDPGRAAAVAGVLAAVHLVAATLVEPTLLGKAVGLSPLVVLAALSAWGLVWGLPGMFLAVPLTAALVLVLDNLDATRPLARLLSDRG